MSAQRPLPPTAALGTDGAITASAGPDTFDSTIVFQTALPTASTAPTEELQAPQPGSAGHSGVKPTHSHHSTCFPTTYILTAKCRGSFIPSASIDSNSQLKAPGGGGLPPPVIAKSI